MDTEELEPGKLTSEQPRKHLPAKIWVPVLVVVGLIVAYLITAAQYQEWPFGASVPQSQEPSTSSGNNSPLSEVEGWQTYRNEEFGFEVKYPEDWLVTISDGENINVPEVKNGSIHLSIMDNPEQLQLLEFLKAKDEELRREQEGTELGYPGFLNFSEIKEISLGGKQSYRFGPLNFTSSDVAVQNNNQVIILSNIATPQGLSEKESETSFNQILSTFRFIKQ